MTATWVSVEPLDTTDPASVVGAGFRAIGTTNEILVTAPGVLDDAIDIALAHLDALDLACSRFRPDSEVSVMAARAENADAVYYASPLFVDYLQAAQHAARLSDGLVDFTVGRAVIASGYDADMDQVRRRPTYHEQGPAEVPGWRRVVVGSLGRVNVPRGAVIDFGATAKAHAADQIARLLVGRLPGGFLVNLGGDIATAGPAPLGGWHIGIEGADGAVRQSIAITDQAVTTSSTQLRTWRTDSGSAHHIIDPRTGETAEAVWGQVTCVATTALEANTASTASLVLGREAPAWLEAHGIPARLERPDGSAVFTGSWPVPEQNQEEL